MPTQATEGVPGHDLSATYNRTILMHGIPMIQIGLAIAMTDGVYARIAPHSGLAMKEFIDVGAGVVDGN